MAKLNNKSKVAATAQKQQNKCTNQSLLPASRTYLKVSDETKKRYSEKCDRAKKLLMSERSIRSPSQQYDRGYHGRRLPVKSKLMLLPLIICQKTPMKLKLKPKPTMTPKMDLIRRPLKLRLNRFNRTSHFGNMSCSRIEWQNSITYRGCHTSNSQHSSNNVGKPFH